MVDLNLFSDFSNDVANLPWKPMLGQNWRIDLHSTRWRFKTQYRFKNIKWQYFSYILCTCEDQSSDPKDYEGRNCNIWDSMAKIGISHRISLKVHDRS